MLRGKNKNREDFNQPHSPIGVGCVAHVGFVNRTSKVAQVKDPLDGTASAGGSSLGAPDSPVEGRCASESADHGSGGYGPFITDGFISLVGSLDKTPVRILRDTGATETFVVESVLPFSVQSNTGNSVLIQGIGMQTMSVPLHKIVLNSDLVQGEIIVGVRPALPVPGVHVILGNILAGDRVWPCGPVPPMVSIEQRDFEQNASAAEFPEVLRAACGVTQSKSCAQAANDSGELADVKCLFPPLPNLLRLSNS